MSSLPQHNHRAHALYRFYDTGGALLYVGITLDPGQRWRAHRDDKPWWHQVANITVETYPTREAVLEAERAAIITERPRYNVLHNRGPRGPQCIDSDVLWHDTSRQHPWGEGWGTLAEHMPDDCHDICARAGALSVYYPHRWRQGRAFYRCQHGHTWECGWGHDYSGDAPEWRGVSTLTEDHRVLIEYGTLERSSS